jgi:hypothetical protein
VKKWVVAAVAAALIPVGLVTVMVLSSPVGRAAMILAADDEGAGAGIGGGVCTVTVDGKGIDLSPVQIDNAKTIIEVGASAGVPERGHIVAIATAMTESGIQNLASRAMPESLGYPNDGVAPGDHKSVGIMQQQPWWWPGGMADGMSVKYQARQFYGGKDDTPGIRGLLDIAGWESMPVTVAAQAVQGSAKPDAYAKFEGLARAVVDGSNITCNDGTGTGSVPAGQWTLPLPKGSYEKASPFGPRQCSWCSTFHKGIDLAAPAGTPIYAAAAGKVVFSGRQGTYGNFILIDHGGGVTTGYAHQSRLIARVGAVVAGGQKIGEVGTTGNSSGNHLHFETRINATPTNPVAFLAERGVTL